MFCSNSAVHFTHLQFFSSRSQLFTITISNNLKVNRSSSVQYPYVLPFKWMSVSVHICMRGHTIISLTSMSKFIKTCQTKFTLALTAFKQNAATFGFNLENKCHTPCSHQAVPLQDVRKKVHNWRAKIGSVRL